MRRISRAAGHLDPFTVKLAPYLAGSELHPEPRTPTPSGSEVAAPRHAGTGRSTAQVRVRGVCARKEVDGAIGTSAQNRFDPELLAVLIHEGGHLRPPRSNTSACAKYADAFRKTSFARRNSRTSRRNSTNSVCSSDLNPGRRP
ncbi:MAG: hypothetical protein OXF41_02710 [bacterium]|nr:hypothetical protein [bacterium]